jgi:hypothetical protein
MPPHTVPLLPSTNDVCTLAIAVLSQRRNLLYFLLLITPWCALLGSSSRSDTTNGGAPASVPLS